MSNSPQLPATISGLDRNGHFHIGEGISLGAEGSGIRVMCGRTGGSVSVTVESLANLIADRYFNRNQILA